MNMCVFCSHHVKKEESTIFETHLVTSYHKKCWELLVNAKTAAVVCEKTQLLAAEEVSKMSTASLFEMVNFLGNFHQRFMGQTVR